MYYKIKIGKREYSVLLWGESRITYRGRHLIVSSKFTKNYEKQQDGTKIGIKDVDLYDGISANEILHIEFPRSNRFILNDLNDDLGAYVTEKIAEFTETTCLCCGKTKKI